MSTPDHQSPISHMAARPSFGSGRFKQKSIDDALAELFEVSSHADIRECRQDVLFDWSGINYFDVGALLWSIVALHALKKQQCDVRLILPDPRLHDRVWKFLRTWRFFETIEDCVDSLSSVLIEQQLRAVTGTTYRFGQRVDPDGNVQQLYSGRVLEITDFLLRSTAIDESTDRYINRWKSNLVRLSLCNLCKWDVTQANRFADSVVAEGLLNAVMHAGGTFLLAAANVDDRYLTLAFADNGAGIPRVLRRAMDRNAELRQRWADMTDADLIRYYAQPEMILDSNLISLATRPGVSSDPSKGGYGLYYLKRDVLTHGGELRIRSGTALVDFERDGENLLNNLTSVPGTMLRVRVAREA